MKRFFDKVFRLRNRSDADLEQRFSEVYRDNLWRDDESRSGRGSRLDSESVAESIEVLNWVIEEHQVKSLNDIPCGDFNWIWKVLKLHPNIAYHGFDVVPDIVERNRSNVPGVDFQLLDITKSVPPRSDLVFCKDLLNHLLYADVSKAIENIARSGSSLFLASNNFGWENVELKKNTGGESRHLDITQAPFDMPAPVWMSTYLGLWDLDRVRTHLAL